MAGEGQLQKPETDHSRRMTCVAIDHAMSGGASPVSRALRFADFHSFCVMDI